MQHGELMVAGNQGGGGGGGGPVPDTPWFAHASDSSPYMQVIDYNTLQRVDTMGVRSQGKFPCFSDDATIFACGGLSSSTWVYNTSDWSLIRSIAMPAGMVTMRSLALSHDGSMIAISGNAGICHVYDVQTGALLATPTSGYYTYKLKFSPDDDYLCMGVYGKEIYRYFRVSDWYEFVMPDLSSTTYCYNITFNKSLNICLVGSSGAGDFGIIEFPIDDPLNITKRIDLAAGSTTAQVQFSFDGSRLVKWDGAVTTLYDTSDWSEIPDFMDMSALAYYYRAFNADLSIGVSGNNSTSVGIDVFDTMGETRLAYDIASRCRQVGIVGEI